MNQSSDFWMARAAGLLVSLGVATVEEVLSVANLPRDRVLAEAEVFGGASGAPGGANKKKDAVIVDPPFVADTEQAKAAGMSADSEAQDTPAAAEADGKAGTRPL